MSNKCPKCSGNLVQEHTKIWNTHARVNEPKYIICDNWTCLKCKTVFLDSELQEEMTTEDYVDEKIRWDNYQDLVQDQEQRWGEEREEVEE